jgi:hypothetical protein
MISSGVWAEQIPLERAHSLKEVGTGTATMKEELERIGYLGTTPASYRSTPMTAHFELHIEQGPILESANQKIGVVQGVQAYRWYTVDVSGRGKTAVPSLIIYLTISPIHRCSYWNYPLLLSR